ncbi:uncharacterized protein LOC131890260 [Tigriopus californicus]|uniref:uncharacterized protein LOC131890260 n=1 Tax=Tigriopus californicus TaxID=6832 RepID=UPI0027DA742B|nr:uncharacterized protein LOC131890260 [Tigriopus californicus]
MVVMSEFSDDYDAMDSLEYPIRPPPPRNYSPEQEFRLPRPPPPSEEYDPPRGNHLHPNGKHQLSLLRPIKPPRLQHILIKKRHDLVKAGPRQYEAMGAPGDVTDEDDDDNDYDGSAYSTLLSNKAESLLQEVSEDELENVDAGETPRGNKSMIIKTDHGDLKSKYNYLGFGLWENTEPTKPYPKPRKASPPPPPPKSEPIWYNCTVAVETHQTSKEIDDLVHAFGDYDSLPVRTVEFGLAGQDVADFQGDCLYEPFEKEDMSEMFRRAFLEKLGLMDDNIRPKYRCYVCHDWIKGRIITAMTHKFHPECFVCTYCRNEFKERSFKSDDNHRPYCYGCFEKLLGHFGTAHFTLKTPVA